MPEPVLRAGQGRRQRPRRRQEGASTAIDAIVHLAAIVGYPACKKEPQVAQATNVEGTRTLLNLRKPDQKFDLRLDRLIYGSIPDYVCNEDTPAAPITLYGETKAAAEQMVLDAGNARRLPLRHRLRRVATGCGST